MCDFCKDIGTDEKALLTHEMEIGNGNNYYLKLEADKLIAELNMLICEGYEDFEIANNQIKRLLKIVRHQKYKRCLAMAEWCDTEVGIADTDGDYKDMQRYQKWYERWMKIAEQFKEAK